MDEFLCHIRHMFFSEKINLRETIATSRKQYIEIAIKLANNISNPHSDKNLRKSLLRFVCLQTNQATRSTLQISTIEEWLSLFFRQRGTKKPQAPNIGF